VTSVGDKGSLAFSGPSIGIDTVHLPAFRDQLADPASAFVVGTFTATERATADTRPCADPARHLAVRFAAKEAFVKAWDGRFYGQRPPLGEGREGLDLRDIEVVNDAWGRPALVLHGRVAAALPDAEISVSLSHDGDHAVAVVMLTTSGAAR